jgi:hypothetical protein
MQLRGQTQKEVGRESVDTQTTQKNSVFQPKTSPLSHPCRRPHPLPHNSFAPASRRGPIHDHATVSYRFHLRSFDRTRLSPPGSHVFQIRSDSKSKRAFRKATS